MKPLFTLAALALLPLVGNGNPQRVWPLARRAPGGTGRLCATVVCARAACASCVSEAEAAPGVSPASAP